jgi:hypothetical protein
MTSGTRRRNKRSKGGLQLGALRWVEVQGGFLEVIPNNCNQNLVADLSNEVRRGELAHEIKGAGGGVHHH